MENCGKVGRFSGALSACSACAGDYEDPERTAVSVVEEEEGGFTAWDGDPEEFLAEE